MKNIMTIIKKELHMVFSNKTQIFFTVIFPGLLLYIMYSQIFGIQAEQGEIISNHIGEIVVIDAPDNFELSDSFNVVNDVSENEYEQKLLDEEIDLILYFETANFDSIATDKNATYSISVSYNPSSSKSEQAFTNLSIELEAYNDYVLTKRYPGENVLSTFDVNVKSIFDSRIQAARAVSMLSFLIVMFLYQGVMSHGNHMFVREKEQKTISSILITPIKRMELVIGKTISALILATIYFVSSFIGLYFSLSGMITSDGGSTAIYSLNELTMLLIVLLTLLVFLVALVLLISLVVKRQREVSVVSMLIFMVIMFSGITTMGEMFNIPTNYYVYLVPIYNGVLSIKAILAIDYTFEFIAITIAANLLYTSIIVVAMTILAKKESIVYSS